MTFTDGFRPHSVRKSAGVRSVMITDSPGAITVFVPEPSARVASDRPAVGDGALIVVLAARVEEPATHVLGRVADVGQLDVLTVAAVTGVGMGARRQTPIGNLSHDKIGGTTRRVRRRGGQRGQDGHGH